MRSLLFCQLLIILVSIFSLISAQTCPRTTTCGACIKTSGCGWCEHTEECLPGNSVGPGGNIDNCTNWQFSQCFDEECRAIATCENCGQDPFCGFCFSTNQCVYGSSSGPVEGTCSNYTFGTALCPKSPSVTQTISPSHTRKASKSKKAKEPPPPPPPKKKNPPPPPPKKNPPPPPKKKKNPPPPPPKKKKNPPPPPPKKKKNPPPPPKKKKSKGNNPPPPAIVSPVLSALPSTPLFVSSSSGVSLLPQTLLVLFSFVVIAIMNRNF